MSAFTRVIRSHRKPRSQQPGNDIHRGNGATPLEAASPSAVAVRPLAAASPLGLPETNPAKRKRVPHARLRRDREYRRAGSLRRRAARQRWRSVGLSGRVLKRKPDASPDLQSSGAVSTGGQQQRRAAVEIATGGLWGAQDEAFDALAVSEGAVLDAGGCTAPRRIRVLIPAPIPPGFAHHFALALEEAAFQLPPEPTPAQLNMCAEQAWREVFEEHFGEPTAHAARERLWAQIPDWVWADAGFQTAFFAEFAGKPYHSENCTVEQLAAALEAAWDMSQDANENQGEIG